MKNKSDYISNEKSFLFQNTNFRLPFILIVLIPFIALMQSSCDNKVEKITHKYIAKPEKTEFVSRQSCIECHEKQYTEWTGSHQNRGTPYLFN